MPESWHSNTASLTEMWRRDMRVAVTGAAGTIGRAVAQELHGLNMETVLIDTTPHQPDVKRADMTEAWAVRECLQNCDAVVHLSGLGTPDRAWKDQFLAARHAMNANITSGANVFAAACELGIRRVVWASSETVLGAPFTSERPPVVLPLTERAPIRAHTPYAMSKATLESLAQQFGGSSRTEFVGLRFSIVLGPADYRRLLPQIADDPRSGLWNLWSYVDIRDTVRACLLALEAETGRGSAVCNIAAEDTLSTEKTRVLLEKYLPELEPPAEPPEDRTALFRGDQARDLLGWEPRHRWSSP
ncbi:NAD(P)-dependent oxidoreductase [Actinoallomurus sp. NBC_01490]